MKQLLTLLTFLTITSCKRECVEQFPRHWLPPSLPISTQIQNISRNVELGTGDGTFRFHINELDHFKKMDTL